MHRHRSLDAAFLVFFLMLANIHVAECSAPVPAEESSGGVAQATFQSPRFQKLWTDLRPDNSDALASFWSEIQGKAPLVEEIPGQRDLLVTFLWRGIPTTRSAALLGGTPAPLPEQPLTQMEGTDLWYLSTHAPRDARITYSFLIDAPPFPTQGGIALVALYSRWGQAVPDPLNPRLFFGQSFIELPDMPAQPWAERSPDVASGTLARHSVRSEILNEDRGFTVYTPVGYRPDGGPYGLVIVFDGEAYGGGEQALIPTPVILDNLIAKEKIPPVVAVLLDNQGTRDRDLSVSDPFSDFLAGELLPWLRRSYRIADDPSRAMLAGSSLGGLCAVYTALRHPEAFGNALSQSGAFWYFPEAYTSEITWASEPGPGWLIRRFIEAPRLPLRFYLDVGLFESGYMIDNRGANRRLREVLEAKGYPVTYREYSGGHDMAIWRGTLADGLLALLGNDRSTSEGKGRE